MLSKETNSREYDVAVLGATGYVGKRLLTELEKLSKTTGLRLLATARSAQKSRDLQAQFPTVAFDVLNVLVAEDVERVVKKAQLVINCIGPFDLYGENVVSACAKLGTHYLDITGEILFARRMIDRYDAVAKQSGSMIIPFAGFDSVPADIGVFLMGHEMREAHSDTVASVDLVFDLRGGLNGGSAATALDMGEKLHLNDIKNYRFLVPGAPALDYTELYRPRYVAPLRKWVAPFFMEPINNKVIFRSLSLLNEAPDYFSPTFRYRESVQVPGGILGATAVAGSLGAAHAALRTPLGRRAASLVAPKPGEGPSEQKMNEGYFEATFVATSTQGKVLIRKMRSEGDPGNVSTVKLLLACVRTMLTRGFTPKAGLQTPASALGLGLLPALRESGINWS